ncbi:hypothetical protein FBUS_09263 [Fasciolopsis buskii]|uniref:C2 domain-containing protein n=1 Tax=Fasciolopsis buskii TaxID=27845 RepID=A0A8E0S304_9TREM|nr:hypothetical protein FBUS_09263 [Fasciolopsis buski]
MCLLFLTLNIISRYPLSLSSPALLPTTNTYTHAHKQTLIAESAIEEKPDNKDEMNASHEQKIKKDKQDGVAELNLEQITYNDIYLEESHESGEGLTDFTEDDSEGGWRNMREFPDSVSAASRVRVFAAQLLLVLSHNKAQSVLNVRIRGTTDVPGRGQGGADAYQLMITLITNKRQSEYSRIRIGPNPTFEDKFEFRLLLADVVNAILRCRLYAYSRGQRTNVLGEGNLELSQINTRIENSLTIPLAPVIEKQGGSSVNLSESEDETNDPEKTAQIEGFLGEVDQTMNEMAQIPLPSPLDSELLLNAAYNPKTGRFECTVQQAHGIHVPGTKNCKPCENEKKVAKISCNVENSYVQLVLRNEDKTILATSKTKICKKLNNPSFNETFFFNLTSSQVDTVSLLVTVYHKKPPGHKVLLGGFSAGKSAAFE